MIDGFRKFISRGNMIDMAVGVVMGGAVTAVVNAIVDDVINPMIAMVFGKPDMSGLLAFTFNGATISFGAVLGALLNFLVIAVAVYFCILVPINKFRDMSEALLVKAKLKQEEDERTRKEQAEPTPEEMTVRLLTEIRDRLAAGDLSTATPTTLETDLPPGGESRAGGPDRLSIVRDRFPESGERR
ncbi:large conductance mechanosensitive channel protein MscL [Bifidobacterium sp. MA2]|uniref:Large-conductance mechanosensitive channel n=1 Tax=Bifidobacterium santillanense TaxID=2809028 RepID=A0ABS5UM17_9BIFI|nr:large conductance mechanosensitive channel protein MscL [Bifidobacterium santillanense]